MLRSRDFQKTKIVTAFTTLVNLEASNLLKDAQTVQELKYELPIVKEIEF